MAGLIRLGAVRALGNKIVKTALGPRRNINTSTKKPSAGGETCSTNPKKDWITYGFSEVDPIIDRVGMHVTAFISISICIVVGGFYMSFAPDPKLCEWSQREAYLELRRRERLGLPAIDSYYIHPDKINLPTDEELGDTEIII